MSRLCKHSGKTHDEEASARLRAILTCGRIEMQTFAAIIERDRDTGYYVGCVRELPAAHSQGATMEELRANLVEVLTMLMEDTELPNEVEFIGTQQIVVV